MEDHVLKPDQVIKPPVTESVIPSLVKRLYGLKVVEQKQMVSYDDLNFRIKAENKDNSLEEYTLKITNYLDSAVPNFIECIAEIQRGINSSDSRVVVPNPIANLNGDFVVRVTVKDLTSEEGLKGQNSDQEDEKRYAVHLLTFLQGTTMYYVPYTPNVMNQFGQLLADLSQAILGTVNTSVTDQLANRRSLWSLYNIPKINPFLETLKISNMDIKKSSLIEKCLNNFQDKILNNDLLDQLPLVLIHGDFNEHNVIVESDPEGGDSHKVYGVLDFTDCHFAPRLFEVSIAIAYAMVESKLIDPFDAAGHVLAGYQSRTKEIGDIQPLGEQEIDLIKVCVESRLAQSLTMGAYSNLRDPSNTYVLSTAERGWSLLERLLNETDTTDLRSRWKVIGDDYESQDTFIRETSITKF